MQYLIRDVCKERVGPAPFKAVPVMAAMLGGQTLPLALPMT